MRTKTMLAGILITLGVGTFAYQGIASASGKKAIEVRLPSVTTQPARDLQPLPVLGAILLSGGLALLIVEQTRTPPLFRGRARYR